MRIVWIGTGIDDSGSSRDKLGVRSYARPTLNQARLVAFLCLAAQALACSSPEEAAPAQLLPPSCVGLPPTCGAGRNENCCESPLVSGGSYVRHEDVAAPSLSNAPATVSAFKLDRFEVTVGRFRKFFNAYDAWRAEGHPFPAEGGHPKVEGSGWNPGWTLAPSTQELQLVDRCLGMRQTWTAAEADREELPINCINWYEAFAFCTWDGGRLATEAEWEFAAAAGEEARVYPWGDTAPESDTALAVHGCLLSGTADCELLDIARVGSVPAGDGKFGQADLAGNIYEWTLDYYFPPYPATCDDCVVTTTKVSGLAFRAIRGGSWFHHAQRLISATRYGDSGGGHGDYTGIRCARDAAK
ncbi:MAG: SUMF1/EgtB/PvdO family nonheme iron enzyme [Polyangiaceae bacterium]|nr:SUMF1/EgtB/PvdO family nonheme iron enzyme [Polyangiaceae bacterium]